MYKQCGVTNFAYGTGPYLRTTELAIAFNEALEKRGHPRLRFIVPWVYGEKQRRIMLEEFAGHEEEYPGEFVLNPKLGAILGSVFYGNNTYEEALSKWAVSADTVSEEAHSHLSGTLETETLSGKKCTVDGSSIVVELNRSPRLRYDVAPTYSTTFGHIAEILEALNEIDSETIAVDRELARRGVKVAEWIERAQDMHCIAYPATFSGSAGYMPRYEHTELVPPITSLPSENTDDLDEGVYVTITGIPGLERLYEEARELGLKLYSNDTEAVAGSEKQLPHVVPNKNILFQFARAGWGSVWLSMFCGTPIVVPDFDPTDDPEIFFNNKMIEELGIGIIYRGQPLKEILNQREIVRQRCAKMRKTITDKWGTLDGNGVCSEMFADDYLRARS